MRLVSIWLLKFAASLRRNFYRRFQSHFVWTILFRAPHTIQFMRFFIQSGKLILIDSPGTLCGLVFAPSHHSLLILPLCRLFIGCQWDDEDLLRSRVLHLLTVRQDWTKSAPVYWLWFFWHGTEPHKHWQLMKQLHPPQARSQLQFRSPHEVRRMTFTKREQKSLQQQYTEMQWEYRALAMHQSSIQRKSECQKMFLIIICVRKIWLPHILTTLVLWLLVAIMITLKC